MADSGAGDRGGGGSCDIDRGVPINDEQADLTIAKTRHGNEQRGSYFALSMAYIDLRNRYQEQEKRCKALQRRLHNASKQAASEQGRHLPRELQAILESEEPNMQTTSLKTKIKALAKKYSDQTEPLDTKQSARTHKPPEMLVECGKDLPLYSLVEIKNYLREWGLDVVTHKGEDAKEKLKIVVHDTAKLKRLLCPDTDQCVSERASSELLVLEREKNEVLKMKVLHQAEEIQVLKMTAASSPQSEKTPGNDSETLVDKRMKEFAIEMVNLSNVLQRQVVEQRDIILNLLTNFGHLRPQTTTQPETTNPARATHNAPHWRPVHKHRKPGLSSNVACERREPVSPITLHQKRSHTGIPTAAAATATTKTISIPASIAKTEKTYERLPNTLPERPKHLAELPPKTLPEQPKQLAEQQTKCLPEQQKQLAEHLPKSLSEQPKRLAEHLPKSLSEQPTQLTEQLPKSLSEQPKHLAKSFAAKPPQTHGQWSFYDERQCGSVVVCSAQNTATFFTNKTSSCPMKETKSFTETESISPSLESQFYDAEPCEHHPNVSPAVTSSHSVEGLGQHCSPSPQDQLGMVHKTPSLELAAQQPSTARGPNAMESGQNTGAWREGESAGMWPASTTGWTHTQSTYGHGISNGLGNDTRQEGASAGMWPAPTTGSAHTQSTYGSEVFNGPGNDTRQEGASAVRWPAHSLDLSQSSHGPGVCSGQIQEVPFRGGLHTNSYYDPQSSIHYPNQPQPGGNNGTTGSTAAHSEAMNARGAEARTSRKLTGVEATVRNAFDRVQGFIMGYPSASEFSLPPSSMGSFVVVQPEHGNPSPAGQSPSNPAQQTTHPAAPGHGSQGALLRLPQITSSAHTGAVPPHLAATRVTNQTPSYPSLGTSMSPYPSTGQNPTPPVPSPIPMIPAPTSLMPASTSLMHPSTTMMQSSTGQMQSSQMSSSHTMPSFTPQMPSSTSLSTLPTPMMHSPPFYNPTSSSAMLINEHRPAPSVSSTQASLYPHMTSHAHPWSQQSDPLPIVPSAPPMTPEVQHSLTAPHPQLTGWRQPQPHEQASMAERDLDSDIFVLGSEDEDEFVSVQSASNKHVCPVCAAVLNTITEKFILHVQNHFDAND